MDMREWSKADEHRAAFVGHELYRVTTVGAARESYLCVQCNKVLDGGAVAMRASSWPFDADRAANHG